MLIRYLHDKLLLCGHKNTSSHIHFISAEPPAFIMLRPVKYMSISHTKTWLLFQNNTYRSISIPGHHGTYHW